MGSCVCHCCHYHCHGGPPPPLGRTPSGLDPLSGLGPQARTTHWSPLGQTHPSELGLPSEMDPWANPPSSLGWDTLQAGPLVQKSIYPHLQAKPTSNKMAWHGLLITWHWSQEKPLCWHNMSNLLGRVEVSSLLVLEDKNSLWGVQLIILVPTRHGTASQPWQVLSNSLKSGIIFLTGEGDALGKCHISVLCFPVTSFMRWHPMVSHGQPLSQSGWR